MDATYIERNIYRGNCQPMASSFSNSHGLCGECPFFTHLHFRGGAWQHLPAWMCIALRPSLSLTATIRFRTPTKKNRNRATRTDCGTKWLLSQSSEDVGRQFGLGRHEMRVSIRWKEDSSNQVRRLTTPGVRKGHMCPCALVQKTVCARRAWFKLMTNLPHHEQVLDKSVRQSSEFACFTTSICLKKPFLRHQFCRQFRR
eukprot:503198-Amphidinium_carterae.1